MPPAAQSEILGKMDVNVPTQAFEQLGPHLITHSVEGVNQSGAKEKVETKLSGKSLD